MDIPSARLIERQKIAKLQEVTRKANHQFRGTLRVTDYAQPFGGSYTYLHCGYSIREIARPFAFLPIVVPFTSREILRQEDNGRTTLFDKRIEPEAREVLGGSFVLDY